jgi:hypothetical protein
MQGLLEARNYTLLRHAAILAQAADAATIPAELEPYRTHVHRLCRELQGRVEANLQDLRLGGDLLVEEVRSNTQLATRTAQLLSARFLSPVVRASETDRLSLRTITWLHAQHPVTAHLPAAFDDGDTGVWPFIHIVPIYFLSCVEQRGLLFQPLLFHELGHLLYACHKQEMDMLVGELQRAIDQQLVPASQRNDRHDAAQTRRRQAIVNRWYTWAQELFCDAVGLRVGGPGFLYAFSAHLSSFAHGDFYQPPTDLERSTHPVSRLRIRFLAARAEAMGFSTLGRQMDEEWSLVARVLGVTEDYHGFYDDRLRSIISQKVDDMLTEANPYHATSDDVLARTWVPGDTPVRLINCAWHVFRENSGTYPEWEAETIGQVLASAAP